MPQLNSIIGITTMKSFNILKDQYNEFMLTYIPYSYKNLHNFMNNNHESGIND